MRDNHRGRPTPDGAPMTTLLSKSPYVQVVEAARRLGVVRSRVYHLIADGRLHATKWRGLYYVPWADVLAYRQHQADLAATRRALTRAGR